MSRLRTSTALLALLAVSCGGVVELTPGDPIAAVTQPQTSLVLAADGQVLARLHAEQDRQDVPLEAVAPVLVEAVVATEDRRFFLHRGVDLAAILRAVVRNLEVGGIDQGGSTITQQYIKNTITGSATTLGRKLREAALAWQLEQRHSKRDILERYLNTIYFGNGAYGVRAAARRYFGVEPDQLTLPQAALLAGLIASPATYDPYRAPEAARRRRRQVLEAMVATGAITRAEADAADAAPLELQPLAPPGPEAAPYAVDAVIREVQSDDRFAAIGATVDERATALFTGGLRIHTTIDPTWQAQAEAAVDAVLTGPDDPQAALVALDPSTGAIRALVGGRGDRSGLVSRFDLATQGRRQPGSAFKPVVLAAALTRGVPLDRIFPGGSCVDFRPRIDWAPCNYGGTAYPALTLREATVRSVNTVYARLAVELGVTPILETARTLGFTSELPPVPALALGAASVTPLEMAGAYAVFATGGWYHEPYLIDRIEAADGTVLYEHRGRSYRALSDGVAFLVTQTLEEVVARGTGVRAQIGRPQAGKTGTSQDNADAWFIGYTPDLVAAVWVGFPEGRVPMEPPTTRIRVEGGRWPAEIWAAFARAALQELPARQFPQPSVDIVVVEVDTTRGCLPNPYTPPELVAPRAYIRGTEPTTRCREPTGPPVEDVPGVVGLPQHVAEQLLRDRGFLVEVRPEASRLYPPGIVTRQRPAAGGATRPEDGHAVILWVSTLVRTRAEVPDVVGQHVTAASAALEADGWVVEVVAHCPPEGCPPDAVSGRVWAQHPSAGSRELEHSVVTLSVYPD